MDNGYFNLFKWFDFFSFLRVYCLPSCFVFSCVFCVVLFLFVCLLLLFVCFLFNGSVYFSLSFLFYVIVVVVVLFFFLPL